MPVDRRRTALDAAVAAITANAGLLTELDSAIGDGDHGANMARGFAAAGEAADAIAGADWGQGLRALGMTLVGKVGGASGPLYGTLFMAMGKALESKQPDAAALVAALGEAIAAVKARGKAEAGEKTMLDVLIPVHAALAERVSAGESDAAALAGAADAAAAQALEATRPMRATKGRASYLGERSVGHLDPGAQSARLLVGAAAAALAEGGR